MAETDEDCRQALVMLLDFEKAYDSLDHWFLYEALRRHGYPDLFVRVIASLHESITVRFLANGAQSARMPVTRGIRQGCPLAPILFILALEPLYQRLSSGRVHRGILLRTRQQERALRVGGYADDTSSYLHGPDEVDPVLATVGAFGEASGLRLNKDKTVAIALHPDGLLQGTPWNTDVKLLKPDERCRYLGFQAGSRPDAEAAWDLARAQVTTRIRLASQKSLTTGQRTLVAKSVILPKLLYVGRHAWPPKDVVRTMQRHVVNYIWTGCFTATTESYQPWIASEAAQLTRGEGGLALPDLETELVAMAAMTVTTWAAHGTLFDHLVGDILSHGLKRGTAPTLHVTPYFSAGTCRPSAAGWDLWAVGSRMVATAGLQPPSDELNAAVQALLGTVDRKVTSRITWWIDTALVSVSELNGEASAVQRGLVQAQWGSTCTEWIPFVEIRSMLPKTLLNGSPTPRRLLKRGTLVKDLLTWNLDRRGLLRVTKAPSYTEQEATILLQYILAWHPTLGRRQPAPNELRLIASLHEHPLVATVMATPGNASTARLRLTAMDAQVLADVDIGSSQEAIYEANLKTKGEVVIRATHPHPVLNRLVRVWTKDKAWTRTRRQFKRAATATKRRKGLRNVSDRAQAWKTDHSRIGEALANIKWQHLHEIVGASEWGIQILYRVKLRAFPSWDVTQNRVGCPIEECGATEASTGHTFWRCEGAQKLWATFYSSWEALGLQHTADTTTEIFSLELKAVPPRVWTLLDELHATATEQERIDIRVGLHDMLNNCWRIGVTSTLQAIWKRRTRYRDPADDSSADRAVAMLTGRLRSAYLTIRVLASEGTPPPHRVAAAKLCYQALTRTEETDGLLHLPYLEKTTHLLLFDGGSRGNPGPGGSGAVITRLGGAAPVKATSV